MKKALAALLLTLVFATASFAAGKTITIGVSPFPHKVIMDVVKKDLEKQGYTLKIKEFADYVTPNIALADKDLDANFMQHIPYLENTVKEKGYPLVWVAKIHIEPLGLYSYKIKKIGDLKDGARVAVPNDPTNEARALRLLEKNGLIEVKQGDLVTIRDVTKNPKKLKLIEIEGPQLPRTLHDVDAAVINTNFASEAKLVPSKDAIIIEGSDSPYSNVIAVRSEDKDADWVKALIAASTSKEIKAFIEKELVPKGIIPAF